MKKKLKQVITDIAVVKSSIAKLAEQRDKCFFKYFPVPCSMPVSITDSYNKDIYHYIGTSPKGMWYGYSVTDKIIESLERRISICKYWIENTNIATEFPVIAELSDWENNLMIAQNLMDINKKLNHFKMLLCDLEYYKDTLEKSIFYNKNFKSLSYPL
jgi:hypothetical protein